MKTIFSKITKQGDLIGRFYVQKSKKDYNAFLFFQHITDSEDGLTGDMRLLAWGEPNTLIELAILYAHDWTEGRFDHNAHMGRTDLR